MKIVYSWKDKVAGFSHPLLGASLPVYFKFLWKYIKYIHPAFIIKFIGAGIMVLLFTPFRWIEAVFFLLFVRKTKVNNPVIVLGHPRGGTTYLHYLLSRDPQFKAANTVEVFTPHIMLLFEKITGFFMGLFLPETRLMDNLKMGSKKPVMNEFALGNLNGEAWTVGYFFPQTMKKAFQQFVVHPSPKSQRRFKRDFYRFCQKLQFKNKSKTLIIKGPATNCRVDLLLEMFPNARFVHIYRDPYRVYQSNLKLYQKILPAFSFAYAQPDRIEKFVLQSYAAYHQKWFEQKGLIPPKNLVEFKYEDFIPDPLTLLKRAYKQLGLHWTKAAENEVQSEIREYKNFEKNVYHNLPESVIKTVTNTWKQSIENWGYTLSK